jgi:putative transposase
MPGYARRTIMLERLFREVKERTRVAGVFPNEMGAHASYRDSLEEQWALKHSLTMDALEAVEKPNPQISRH